MTTELIRIEPAELMRQASDAANAVRAIVTATVQNIDGRRYVRVEGWQAIAVAHGCCASARDVERIEGGVRAIAEIRRMSDGAVLATAEGFVGDDEKRWAARAEYARRAMAQTRAISRVCRSVFAHVVVLIDAGLSTTPAEEISEVERSPAPRPVSASQRKPGEEGGEPSTSEVESEPLGTRKQAGLVFAIGRQLGWTQGEIEKWLVAECGDDHVSRIPAARVSAAISKLQEIVGVK